MNVTCIQSENIKFLQEFNYQNLNATVKILNLLIKQYLHLGINSLTTNIINRKILYKLQPVVHLKNK